MIDKPTATSPAGWETTPALVWQRTADRSTWAPVPPRLDAVPAWMDAALCAQADPEAWFPAKGNGATARAAKRICARCPVRAECLEYALAGASVYGGIDTGVWGGTTPMERRALRRGRSAA